MADKGRSTRSLSSKKNQGKVPKRMDKAEREKMKREHLNDLFLALDNSLGNLDMPKVSDQTNGKACILGEATRIVKDKLEQIECLKRENAALLSDSQYAATEKNELQDENSALQDQIEKLQTVLEERMAQSNLDLNKTPPESKELDMMPLIVDCRMLPFVEPSLQQTRTVTPIFVMPVCSDLQVYPEPNTAQLASKPICNVSKPHARYPSPGDSWPSQLLENP